jgi:class 3 adenylate cyclase
VRIAQGLLAAARMRGMQARAGVAAGTVLALEGDYFGPVVNLASRLTELAVPGEMLVPAVFRDELRGITGEEASGTQKSGDSRLHWVSKGIQPVRSIGPVEVFAVERSG